MVFTFDFEQNSHENWLKNKEVMKFWNFANFQETVLDQSLLNANDELNDLHF